MVSLKRVTKSIIPAALAVGLIIPVATSASAQSTKAAPAEIPAWVLEPENTIMRCSDDRPIRWTVAAHPKANKKNVRVIKNRLGKYLDTVSRISRGKVTYQYVPDVPVVSREKGPFGGNFEPAGVSANRDVDVIVTVTTTGKVSWDDPFVSKQRDRVDYSLFTWDRDWSRPEQFRYDTPPAPYVASLGINHTIAKNADSQLRKFAIATVVNGKLESPTEFNAKARTLIREMTSLACDPNVERNWPPSFRDSDGNPIPFFEAE